MVKIVKPAQIDFVKTLVMGDIGLGKTRFLGTAQLDPRTFPILILDFEGGTRTLKGLDPEPDVVRIRDWNDFDQAYDIVADPKTKYKSVAIDSASEVHMYTLFSILDQESEGRKKKGQSTDVIQEGDYGKGLVQMRRLLRSFRDLDMHVFFTALCQDVIEPGVGLIRKPSFAGRLTNDAPGIMDAVIGMTYLENPSTKQRERAAVLKNYPNWAVKIRTDWDVSSVPDEIFDPTVTKLFDALGIEKSEGRN